MSLLRDSTVHTSDRRGHPKTDKAHLSKNKFLTKNELTDHSLSLMLEYGITVI